MFRVDKHETQLCVDEITSEAGRNAKVHVGKTVLCYIYRYIFRSENRRCVLKWFNHTTLPRRWWGITPGVRRGWRSRANWWSRASTYMRGASFSVFGRYMLGNDDGVMVMVDGYVLRDECVWCDAFPTLYTHRAMMMMMMMVLKMTLMMIKLFWFD